MISITEKLRAEIALSIASLELSEADRIAAKAEVSRDMVYRYLRQMKKGKTSFRNDMVVEELAIVAARKKKASKIRHKRASDLEKQLANIR